MDLGRYIYQVLKHRNEVFVKGLGSFKRIHTSSVFDDQKGQYLPPVTYLEFEANNTVGFDFTDYVQQANQLSRSEADQLIDQEVLLVLESLKDKGTANLNHLGQLIRHGNSLVFKPVDLSGFQLQPVEGTAHEIPSKVEEEIPVEAIAEEPTVVEQVEEENVLANDIVEETLVDDKNVGEAEVFYEESKSSSRTGTYIWISVLALAIISGLFYYNKYKSDQIIQKPVSIDTNQTVKPANTEISADTTNKNEVDSTLNSSTQTSNDSVAVKKPLIPANHKYLIVIGTHGTLAQAYEQAESFNKAGIKSVRVVPSNLANNKKKVIWDSYETKEQADSALKYVQKHHVTDAWRQSLKK